MSIVWFLHGYRSENYQQEFSLTMVQEVVVYAANIPAHFFGFFTPNSVDSLVVGFVLLLLQLSLLTLACFRIYRFIETKSKESEILLSWLVVCLYIGFSVLFVFLTAQGRFFFGVETAFASRYTTYLMPGLLGVYITIRVLLSTFSTCIRAYTLFLLLSFVTFSEYRAHRVWVQSAEWWSYVKQEYFDCIKIAGKRPSLCQKQIGIYYYPDGNKLDILYTSWEEFKK